MPRRAAGRAYRPAARVPEWPRPARPKTGLPPSDHARSMPTFPPSPIAAANVASVPQRSPLRYPGGKTWLVPHIRAWLAPGAPHPLLVEPFAGGAIVALTAVAEGLAKRALLVEKDPDVAAFWQAALEHGPALAARVRAFTPSRQAVDRLASAAPRDVIDHGFRTLVLNRTRRGGVLAPGAALIRQGENGAGLASRWYPETLARRIEAIAALGGRIDFREGCGLRQLEELAAHRPGARLFVDPPYTAGGKGAGRRLYAHHDIDHERLFQLLAASRHDFLLTYDLSDEIATLIAHHGFHAATVTMKTGHHARLPEAVVTRKAMFS